MLLPVWMQNNDFHRGIIVNKLVWVYLCCINKTQMPTITSNTQTPGLTRPQSKQTQSELTIDLILRLHAPSAASSEEVWGIGLLHEDLLQRTCSGSRRRLSSQHKGIKREDVEGVQLVQLLTLWIFSAACAAGHSCRVGLWRHWVRRQNMKCSKLKHMLTSPWNTKKTNSYITLYPSNWYKFSCMRLTGKCKKHSEESQEGCICPGHLQLWVWIVERYE